MPPNVSLYTDEADDLIALGEPVGVVACAGSDIAVARGVVEGRLGGAVLTFSQDMSGISHF